MVALTHIRAWPPVGCSWEVVTAFGKAPAAQFPTAPPGPAHSFTRPAGSGMTLPSASLLTVQVLGSGVAMAMLAEGGLGDQQSLCRPRGQGAGEADADEFLGPSALQFSAPPGQYLGPGIRIRASLSFFDCQVAKVCTSNHVLCSWLCTRTG